MYSGTWESKVYGYTVLSGNVYVTDKYIKFTYKGLYNYGHNYVINMDLSHIKIGSKLQILSNLYITIDDVNKHHIKGTYFINDSYDVGIFALSKDTECTII
jgi:hypothetical protein